tara:strand:+ start:40574 stop:40882 length:309 start_codon:yes stop_codon:yes gene_type:complete
MMTHPDKLTPLGNREDDYRHRVFFANGYGASIACGPHNYGCKGDFELAVLIGEDDDNCRIATAEDVKVAWFDTLGIATYVSPMELSAHLAHIVALPPIEATK